MSDNSYQGLPHDDILYSSAATDETQTNWNGVLGYLRMRVEEPVFIERVSVYPVGSGLKSAYLPTGIGKVILQFVPKPWHRLGQWKHMGKPGTWKSCWEDGWRQIT